MGCLYVDGQRRNDDILCRRPVYDYAAGGGSSDSGGFPGDIYLTDITESGTYEDGYNRVLNLGGGIYTKLQLWNVAGTAGGVTLGGTNSFVINIGAGTSLLNTNPQLMGWSNQDRIVAADITLNVDQNAGTINGFCLVGDGNKTDAFQTTGTYIVNIHGGEWAGTSVSSPNARWCIGLGQESFRHTGDVTFTIDGGTFAQLVTAGTTRGAGQKSTILGNVALNLDGGTFNGSRGPSGKRPRPVGRRNECVYGQIENCGRPV